MSASRPIVILALALFAESDLEGNHLPLPGVILFLQGEGMAPFNGTNSRAMRSRAARFLRRRAAR